MSLKPLVLVVDDDADSRNILRTVLEYYGYTAAEAEHAREGVRLALELRPAVVVAALELNTLSGFELLTLLRADPRLAHTPVVAVSAHDLRPEALASGFRAFLAKPFSLPSVIATLQSVLPLDEV